MPPRQLPWLKPGGSSKAPSKAATSHYKRLEIGVNDEDDDEFFKGTVLATSRKGKGRVDSWSGSEDDLPDLTSLSKSPRKSDKQGHGRSHRAFSSSPPPVADLPPPKIEFMEKASSRFDLRDDEWMMVEDEFLHTAKLFTRHLHLAEYEKIKETIQQKKEALRPVAANAKPSADAMMKNKADAQLRTQKIALRDILDARSGRGLEDLLHPPKRVNQTAHANSHNAETTRSMSRPCPPQKQITPDTSDDDDLDAPRRSISRSVSHTTTFAKPELLTKRDSFTSRPERKISFDLSHDERLPSLTPSSVRSQRKTSFDRFDKASDLQLSSPAKPLSPTKPPVNIAGPQSSRPRPSQRASSSRSLDLLSDFDFPRRDKTDRIIKRKAEQENSKKREEKKPIKLDDIPTFLL